MAFSLEANSGFIHSGSLIDWPFQCYDTLGDPDFDFDRDELLHHRSAYELVRDQLTDAQRAELDVIDAFWRANAALFNADFALDHARRDLDGALQGYVFDEQGNAPAIPRSHWWWWPINLEES